MDDLSRQVLDAIRGQTVQPSAQRQSSAIDAASRLFDELQAKGLIEPPAFKLAPLDSVPPKSYCFGR